MKFISWKICLLYLILLSTDVLCTETSNKNRKLTTLLSNKASLLLGEIPSEFANSASFNIYTVNDKPSSEFFDNEANNNSNNNAKDSNQDSKKTSEGEEAKDKNEPLVNLEENLGKRFRDFRISLDLSNKQNKAKTDPNDKSYPIDKYLLPDTKRYDEVNKGKSSQGGKEKRKESGNILEIMDGAEKKSNSTISNTNKKQNKNGNKNHKEQTGRNRVSEKQSVFDSLKENGNDNSDKIKVFEPKGKISDVDLNSNSERLKANINKKNKYKYNSYPKSNAFQGFLSLLNRNEAEEADNTEVLDINRPKFILQIPSIYDYKVKNQQKKEVRSKPTQQTDVKTSIPVKKPSSNPNIKIQNNTYAANKLANKTDTNNNNTKSNEAKITQLSVFDDINKFNSTQNPNNKSNKALINTKDNASNNSSILGKESKQIIDIISVEAKKTIDNLKQELASLKQINKDLTKIQNEKGSKITKLQEAVKREEKEKTKLKEKLDKLESKLKLQGLEMQELKQKAEKQTDISSFAILKNENFRSLLKHLVEVNLNNLNAQNYKCMMACADVKLNEKQYYDFGKAIKVHLDNSVFNAHKEQSISQKLNGVEGKLKGKLKSKVIKDYKKSDVNIGFIEKGDFNASRKNNTNDFINNTYSKSKDRTELKNGNGNGTELNLEDKTKNNIIPNNNKLRKFEVVNNRISLEINKLKNIIEQNNLAPKTDKISASALEEIKINNINKVNELEKIIKKLESDKQQGIEIMFKVSTHNKHLLQENTLFKKQITDTSLKNDQLEKANLNLNSYNERIKEIVKGINKEFTKSKNILQTKLIENYDLQEKLSKCESRNENYRVIVDSNLVMNNRLYGRESSKLSDFDYSVPDDSFSSKSKFTGFSFKSIHSDIKIEKSDESSDNSLIEDIKSFLKNETKLEQEAKNNRGKIKVEYSNYNNSNRIHGLKNYTTCNNSESLKKNQTVDKIRINNNTNLTANNHSMNYTNNSASKLGLDKIVNESKKLNESAKQIIITSKNNDDSKIQRKNVVKILNKEVIEDTEENVDYKFLYKDDLNQNPKKAAFQKSLDEEDNYDMKHLLTQMPINFLEISSSINPSAERPFNFNSFLEETENISTLEDAGSESSEAEIKDNLSEYKKLMAKQKELNEYLEKTEKDQKEQRTANDNFKDEENKSFEEIKAENSIQDANLKRDFILNRIKKLKDQKYLQSIEETKSRIAKKLNRMKENEELGSEAESLLNKFANKNPEKLKNKSAKPNKNNYKILNKFEKGKDAETDLFGLENKPFVGKKKKKINVNKGKLNLTQLSKFAKRILLEDNLSSLKDLGKNKDLNQNICWEMMNDLLLKDSHFDDFEIDENEIYHME